MKRTCVVVSLVLLATAPVWAVGPRDAIQTPDALVRLTPDQAAAMEGRLDLVLKRGVPADAGGRHLYVARGLAADRAVPEAGTLAGLKAEPVQLASLPEISPRNGASARFETYLNELLASSDLVSFGADGRLLWEGYVRQPATASINLSDGQPMFGSNATVAIIDTGVDPDHELFRDQLVVGYDFLTGEEGFASEWAGLDQTTSPILPILSGSSMVVVEQTTSPILPRLNQTTQPILTQDQIDELIAAGIEIPPAFGHGTLAAGIVHRMAPDAWIMPLRAFDGSGYGAIDDVIEAIYYAVDHGADVINMSFSIEEHSAELQAAIDYATDHGVLMVAAAGNERERATLYPAALAAVIGVGSTDPQLRTSAFSNYGNGLVTIASPGEYVISAFPGGGWAMCAGTSFSAPWVAGLLAVLVEKGDVELPGALAALSDAQKLTGHHNTQFGFGGLDAVAAWEAVQ
jgi:subtilisin family serine protease